MNPKNRPIRKKLFLPITELDLSVRSFNCLREANTYSVVDLVNKNESDLLRLKNFGKRSLKEVKSKLANKGLKLGMKIKIVNKRADLFNIFPLFSNLPSNESIELLQLKNKISVYDCLIENVISSKSIQKSLKKAHIKTLSDLLFTRQENLCTGEWMLTKVKKYLIEDGRIILTLLEGDLELDNSVALPIFESTFFKPSFKDIIRKELHNIKIDNLSFSQRAENLMYDLGVSNILDLVFINYNDLLKLKNCGKKTAKEIIDTGKRFIEKIMNNRVKDNIKLPECLHYLKETVLSNDALRVILKKKIYVYILKKRCIFDDNPLTLEEIGKEFSITRERVRQITKKCIHRLFHGLDYEYKEFMSKFIKKLNVEGGMLFEDKLNIAENSEFMFFCLILNEFKQGIIFDNNAKIWVNSKKNYLRSYKVIANFLKDKCLYGKPYSVRNMRLFAKESCESPDLFTNNKDVILRLICAYFFCKVEDKYYLSNKIKDSIPMVAQPYFAYKKSKILMNKRKAIENYLLKVDRPVTWEEIEKEIGLRNNESTFLFSDKIVKLGNDQYIHSDNKQNIFL